MKTLFLAITFLITTSATAGMTYGMIQNKKKTITLSQALKSELGKETSLTAKVGKVCEKKGCWMTLTGPDTNIRVTFKDYGFFVPVSLIGKEVRVQGTLKKYAMTKKEADHYAQDAGKKAHEGSLVEYRMVATGVEVF